MYKNGVCFLTPAEWLAEVRKSMETKEMREARKRLENGGVYLRCGLQDIAMFEVKKPFEISKVIFDNPATVVYWADGTKTVVTLQDNIVNGRPKAADSYSKETGLALCFMKKACNNFGSYNNVFRKWIKDYDG